MVDDLHRQLRRHDADGDRVANMRDDLVGGGRLHFDGLDPVSGEQLGLGDKAANALRLGTSPIVRALVDFDGGMDMVRDLDDITFTEWFTRFGGSRGSIDRMWDPIAYALGFMMPNRL